MRRTYLQGPVSAVIALVAAIVATACAGDRSLAPHQELAVAAAASSSGDGRTVDLGACSHLAPPAGSTLVVRMYAQGVQVYRWNGGAWAFVAPEATLSADAAGNSVIGTHYAGPVWESVSGGTVKGAVIDRCTKDASAIQWLLLGATPSGPGIFHRVTHIQRVNTVGGIAPSAPGTSVGAEARVPYTTEYLFWRAP